VCAQSGLSSHRHRQHRALAAAADALHDHVNKVSPQDTRLT
jgi:hypothetical protein